MITAALLIGALIGLGMAINGKRKRQDRREANRYLAQQSRAERGRVERAERTVRETVRNH